jgi:hypothetical protein
MQQQVLGRVKTLIVVDGTHLLSHRSHGAYKVKGLGWSTMRMRLRAAGGHSCICSAYHMADLDLKCMYEGADSQLQEIIALA